MTVNLKLQLSVFGIASSMHHVKDFVVDSSWLSFIFILAILGISDLGVRTGASLLSQILHSSTGLSIYLIQFQFELVPSRSSKVCSNENLATASISCRFLFILINLYRQGLPIYLSIVSCFNLMCNLSNNVRLNGKLPLSFNTPTMSTFHNVKLKNNTVLYFFI